MVYKRQMGLRFNFSILQILNKNIKMCLHLKVKSKHTILECIHKPDTKKQTIKVLKDITFHLFLLAIKLVRATKGTTFSVLNP